MTQLRPLLSRLLDTLRVCGHVSTSLQKDIIEDLEPARFFLSSLLNARFQTLRALVLCLVISYTNKGWDDWDWLY